MAVNNENLSKISNVKSISASQLSRKLRVMPIQLLRFIYEKVLLHLQIKRACKSSGSNGYKLNIVDATTITCAVKKYKWAKFRKTKAGVKLHLRIKYNGRTIPGDCRVTSQKKADKTQMDELIIYDPNTINVYDRAYIDYKKFDKNCSGPQKTLFVTKLKSNSFYKVIEELPTNGDIIKHQIVILGKGQKVMKHKLRLIKTTDTKGKIIYIITNDFKLSAEEIAEIYRLRWQIEIFFKWIKQHFQIKHLYGTSPQAVENQLLIALITYCLFLLMQDKYPSSKSLHEMTQLIIACLFENLKSFIKKLRKPPSRTSKGRRKEEDFLGDYEEFERQVMNGEREDLLMV